MNTLPSSFTHISKISSCPNVTLGNTLSKRLNEYVYEFFLLPENSFLISNQASAFAHFLAWLQEFHHVSTVSGKYAGRTLKAGSAAQPEGPLHRLCASTETFSFANHLMALNIYNR